MGPFLLSEQEKAMAARLDAEQNASARHSERQWSGPAWLGIVAGVQFLFAFGEVNGWLSYRFCGTWHREAEGEFTERQRTANLAARYCTRWHLSGGEPRCSAEERDGPAGAIGIGQSVCLCSK